MPTFNLANNFEVEGITLKNFINLSSQEKEFVLNWRNDPRIRQWMINKETISLNNHLSFINKLETDSGKGYWMASVKGRPIGSVYLYGVTPDMCYWGYYVDPELIGSSYGLVLEYVVLQFVFGVLGLKELRCETLSVNTPVLRLHSNVGFRVVAEDDSLVEMEITGDEWIGRRSALGYFVQKIKDIE